MEHALSEWSYLIRFHPSYAWARSFLASNTRDRLLLAESAIFPIMSQRSAPTWYALTVNNWVTPSATVKKRSSAVFAKRTATTLSIVNYLVGGALKKLTLVVSGAAAAPPPESRPSQPLPQPSSDEPSSDGPPPSVPLSQSLPDVPPSQPPSHSSPDVPPTPFCVLLSSQSSSSPSSGQPSSLPQNTTKQPSAQLSQSS